MHNPANNNCPINADPRNESCACDLPGNVETIPQYGGKQGYGTFRTPTSIAEMIGWCSTHSHIWVRSLTKDARQVKVNGKVRTWKRDPNRVEIPIKYGLYEYATLDASDIDRILIPVKE